MDDWEEFESWHEDLMAWERFARGFDGMGTLSRRA